MSQKLIKKNFELYQVFVYNCFVPKCSNTFILSTADGLKALLCKNRF